MPPVSATASSPPSPTPSWSTSSGRRTRARGRRGNQIPPCCGADADKALERAHHSFRWSALGWKVQAELPNPVNFDAAAAQVRPEDLSSTIPTGPDVQPYLDAVEKAAGAGYENIAFLQIGEDQDGFFRFWQDELGPALRERDG